MKVVAFRSSIVLLAGLVAAGCEARYEDVSRADLHHELVGQRCELLVALRAHGVGEKYGPRPRTEYVSVWNPGFTGPEVTFTTFVPAGSQLRVVAAKQCSNCPLDRRVHYQVALAPEPTEFTGIPVLIRAESFTPQEVVCNKRDLRPNSSSKPTPLRGAA